MVKTGCASQRRAARLPITLRMRALGMTSQRRDGRLSRVREPRPVPALPGLAHPASDVHGPPSPRACGHGHRKEAWGPMSPQPLARRGGHGGPPQPLDERRMVGGTGRHRGRGLPCLPQPLHVPSPCGGPTDPLDGVPCGGEVGQARAATRGPSMPAAPQAPTPRGALHVPRDAACDPLALGAWGVEGLERLMTPRVPPLPVFTTGIKDGRGTGFLSIYFNRI